MADACQRAGRSPDDVRLILVTKTVSLPSIRAAIAAGEHRLGENKAQELVSKAPELQMAEWHFIGHLQSNKIKDILPWTSLLHSLDRIELAQKLATHLRQAGRRLKVLIQVNVSGEASKSGVAPEQAAELIERIAALPELELRGLMTIGANTPEQPIVRAGFRRLRELRDAAQQQLGQALPELSMGMSGDFETAIEEGATLIRVGSAIFGPRQA